MIECKYLHIKRVYGYIGEHNHKGKVNATYKMKLFVIQDFQEIEEVGCAQLGLCVCGGGEWCGFTGERAPHTCKYLDQFLMVLLETFTTRACFCDTIETRGCNPMFQLQIHILLNILISS